jgi:hypothetical protein
VLALGLVELVREVQPSSRNSIAEAIAAGSSPPASLAAASRSAAIWSRPARYSRDGICCDTSTFQPSSNARATSAAASAPT